MFKVQMKYSLPILFSLFLTTNLIGSQKTLIIQDQYIFNWQKANGDAYEIPVENNLEIKIEKQRINRALMQILLKALINSRDFEGFTPIEIALYTDDEDQIAKLDFSVLDAEGNAKQFTDYFRFDEYGNVFNQLFN